MRQKRLLALLLALLLVLSGCGPAAQVEPSPAPSEPVTESEPAQSEPPAPAEPAGPWMEDWELFWKTLEENYPYGDVLRRTTGRTLAGIERTYRVWAERVRSEQELLDLLLKVDDAFKGIGHLWVHNAQLYARFYKSMRQAAANNPMCRYEAEVLDNEKSKALYGWKEPEETGTAGGVSNSGGGAEDGNTNLTFAYYPEQKAAYVEVLHMDPGGWGWNAERQALLEFFQTIEAEGYEHCIIDITQNGGGSDNYMALLVGPNLVQPAATDHYALINAGDEVPPYHEACGIRAQWRPIEELPVEELPALEPGDLEWATHYMTMSVGTGNYSEQPAFSGRFWLLVGPRVYSASEYFAVFCKDTGFATLVGQTTGGDGIGRNPLVCVLPNSGIVYQFSTEHGLNLDGSSNEAVGTAPDIEVPAGEDVLQVCLRAIEEAGT